MRSIEYADYEIHKRLHDNFREYTLPALEEEMEEMNYSTESIRHFLGVCIGWEEDSLFPNSPNLSAENSLLHAPKAAWKDNG